MVRIIKHLISSAIMKSAIVSLNFLLYYIFLGQLIIKECRCIH